jgi:hypothetical protein
VFILLPDGDDFDDADIIVRFRADGIMDVINPGRISLGLEAFLVLDINCTMLALWAITPATINKTGWQGPKNPEGRRSQLIPP